MKYIFSIKNIDCGNCASKIERALQQEVDFRQVTLNFVMSKLEVEGDNLPEEKILMERVQKIARKYEDGVVVLPFTTTCQVEKKGCNCDTHHHEDDIAHDPNHSQEEDHGHDHNHGSSDKIIARILVGVLLLAVGIWTDFLMFYIAAYLIVGYDILLKAGKNILKGKVFDENFLMGIATVAAFGIREYPEAVAVMVFYQIGEYLQHRAVNYSRKAITELMDIRPEFARVVGSTVEEKAPEAVNIGEVIEVRAGEKVPLDGILIEGSTLLDMAALTGESVPVAVKEGEEIISGSINKDSVIRIQVTKLFKDSTVSKILSLIEDASSKKSVAENFITKFARVYTPIVVISAAVIAVLPSLVTGNWHQWIYTSIVFLVISCPCALVVSIPLGFFGGIGAASKKGILIKGSNYLERLNEIDTVVFDKTGTITKGAFAVEGIFPVEKYTKEEVLTYAARLEAYSNHPIALAVKRAVGAIDKEEVKDYREVKDYKEVAGYGIGASLDGKSVLVGNGKWMDKNAIIYVPTKEIGTILYVAVEKEYIGCIVVRDEMREDSKKAIKQLKEQGIKKTVILTGDKKEIANSIGEKAGVDEVYAELLPQDKVKIVEELLAKGHTVAFVGDGINDAPVLARADLGIAMGGIGSDAAIEASDVVLMTDELNLLNSARKIAKKTKRIVTQNIVFAIGIKLLVMVLSLFGIASMWLAVFADVGVSILAILNSLRVLKD